MNNEEDTDDDGDDDNDGNDDINQREEEDATALARGLQRLGRANKGRTECYANYTLLLHARKARKAARGGPKQAILRDGEMLFLADDVNDAKPFPVEDRLEYAFEIILQQYSIGAGLKKFQERGEKGVTKELT